MASRVSCKISLQFSLRCDNASRRAEAMRAGLPPRHSTGVAVCARAPCAEAFVRGVAENATWRRARGDDRAHTSLFLCECAARWQETKTMEV
eukprot:5137843-Prymnesium_polylepis.1